MAHFDENHISAAADRLDAILAAHRVVPRRNSWPARAMAAARSASAWERDHECRRTGEPCVHLHESLARAQRIADLLVLVDLIEDALRSRGGPRVAERLKLLAAGDHTATSRAAHSNERDLVFELMCAGWLSRFATDVDLVDPPDVIGTYWGNSWGIACKAASGSPRTAYAAIKKGIRQLDASDCELGAVLLRTTDVFPHGELVPGRSPDMRTVPSYRHDQDALTVAANLALPFVVQVLRDADRLANLYRRSPKLVAVVCVFHTMANLSTPGGAVSATIGIPLPLVPPGPWHPFLDDFLTAFNA